MIDVNMTLKIDWISSDCQILALKLSFINYVILKLKPLVNEEKVLTIYHACNQSTISYVLTVWGISVGVGKLLILQKRAIRIIADITDRENFLQNKE